MEALTIKEELRRAQQETRKRNRRQAIRTFFGRGILIKFCFAYLVVFFIVAIFAPLLAPYDPTAQQLTNKFAPLFSEGHILGTDYLGRDVLSRLIYGGRVSFAVSMLAGIFSASVGIVLGLISGYVGGWINRIIMGLTDVMLSIPGLVLTLVIATIMGKSVLSMTLAIGIGRIPTYIRMMNGLVLQLRQNDYIEASRLVGLKKLKVLFKHLLPNTFPSMIVLFTINLGNAIMTESSLSYLGIGISPPTATWGNMVNDAYNYLLKAPRLAIIPGVCIIALIISFNVVGDSLRDALDPRLRGKL